MFQLNIPIAQLAAAVLFAAKKDIRFYLNGVFFDSRSKCLVATNGKVLYVGKNDSVSVSDGVATDVILPLDFVVDLAKDHAKDAVVTLTIDGRNLAGPKRLGLAIDGTYPDWRRIYPQKEAGVLCGQIDANFYTLLAKANHALGRSKGACGYVPVYGLGADSGDPAVAVLGSGQAHVVMMPWRPRGSIECAPFERFAV